MKVVASAPGKIVLSGEYAVLFGAPAICMAVDRRAVARVSGSADGECHVVAPGFSGGDEFAVVDALCTNGRPPRTIELDTRSFYSDSQKLGVGSSAALTVALTAAIRNSTDILAAAFDAHRRLQAGKGSGIDIAAAVHGGLIEYEMSSQRVRSLPWPDGLVLRVLWTGVPASTGAKLDVLAEQAVRPSRSALGLAAERMAAAWGSGAADGILEEYVAYTGVLRQFSVDHDLGIFDAGHDELTDAALVNDLVYKPAGAGGGDVGVLFGRDEGHLDAFVAEHAGLVGSVVGCALDPDGVRLEPA